MIKCPNCQTINPAGTAFCSKCGIQFFSSTRPTGQQQPPPQTIKNKSNLKTVFIVLGIVIGGCVLCGLIGVIKEAVNPSNTNSAAANQPPPPSSPVPVAAANTKTNVATPVPVSNITWNDYDRVYNLKSNSTDVQKESLWENFEGKTVTWQGEVSEVSKGAFSGSTVSIKMNKETLTSDILLSLKKDQESKMMSLTKGQKITFTGKLKSYGGAVLPLSIDEGEIK